MADSASVEKKNKLFIKGKCFNDCEATLIVGDEKTELYVCMDQSARMSEYFRIMFFGDFKEKYQKEFNIKDETSEDTICFFNAVDADPDCRKITNDSVEVLMRLADKFQCDVLKKELKNYVEINEPNCKSAAIILNWLLWSVQYNMPQETIKVCLPGVACLSLSTLSSKKKKIGSELYSKLVQAKLELNFKSIDFCTKKIAVNKCSSCESKDCLPYKVIWCINESTDSHITKIEIVCRGCVKSGHKYNKCCEKSDVYYKCRFCQIEPSSYKNKDQCLCGRKNYEILFNEMLE